nr:PD-(D/E)XK nuclease family protein [Candidatus Solincola tengchongensis]
MVYSHTQLETYERCPFKYRLLYLDRVKAGRRSIEAFMGSVVHVTLEKLYRDLLMSRLPDLEELNRFYLDTWRNSYGDDVFIVRSEYTEEDYLNTGLKCLGDYYRRYYPFRGRGRPLWLEKRVQIPLRDEKGRQVSFIGVLDRLDYLEEGRYEIHDYKTSQLLPSQDVLEEDRQLSLYQMAVEAAFPDVREVELVWHYLVFDRELRLRREKDKLEQVAAAALKVIREIEECRDFLPRESELCDWCEVQEHCPKRKHLYMVAKLPVRELGMDRGIQLVDEYAEWYARKREAEERLEEVRKEIIEFADFHGVEKIQGNAGVVSVSRTRRPVIPAPGSEERGRLEEALRETGKWEEVCALNPNRLASLVLGEELDEESRNRICGLLSWEEGVTLRLRRAPQ